MAVAVHGGIDVGGVRIKAAADDPADLAEAGHNMPVIPAKAGIPGS